MSLGRMRAPGGARHPMGLGAIFLALFPAGELLSQDPPLPGPPCPPPLELRVCQDTYSQPLGRVYLHWRNEASYDSQCIYIDGILETELPGKADLICIPGLSSGSHEFTLKTTCLSRSDERKVSFTVRDDSPYLEPVKSMTCGVNTENEFAAKFDGLAERLVSVDIFKQDMNDRPMYAGSVTLDPENPMVTVEDVTIGLTQVFFQFFDVDGYGSVIVGCPGDCHSPTGIRVHQDTFGDTGSIFLTWLRDGGQRGFEISVNGVRMGGLAGALSEFHHLQGLEVGKPLTFDVRALCWGTEQPQPSEPPTLFTLQRTSSNTRPIREMASTFLPDPAMSCVGPERGKIEAVWDPGSEPQDAVDILLRRGSLPLRYVTTVPGAQTAFTLDEAFGGDALFLQFFDRNGFGSPLQGTSFRRGDANHGAGLDLSDGIRVLNFLFLGTETIPCSDAADANDDGGIDVSDGLAILNFLFLGYAAPPEPGHLACGQDPTPDDLPLCEINCPEGSLP